MPAYGLSADVSKTRWSSDRAWLSESVLATIFVVLLALSLMIAVALRLSQLSLHI